MNLPIDGEEGQYTLGSIDLEKYYLEPEVDYSLADLKNLIVVDEIIMPGDFLSNRYGERVNKLKIEEKKSFLKYLQKKKEEGIDVGDQWAFFRDDDQCYAYGANIVLKNPDDRKRKHGNLIKQVQKEISPPQGFLKKITKISALIVFLLVAFVAILSYFQPEYRAQFKDWLGSAKKAIKVKPDSVKFLEKEFPDISSWKSATDSNRKAVAKDLLDVKNIEGIWKHVTSNGWNSNLSGEHLQKARARFILYDLINYNPKIKEICHENEMIDGTRFQKICEIYGRSYTNKIFYWKTGNIKIPSKFKKIDDIFSSYNIPVSDSKYTYCYNTELAVIEMKRFGSVPLKVSKKPENSDSDWLMVTLQNINENKINEVVLFKVGLSVSVGDATAKMLIGDKKIGENILITWHLIPQETVNKKGWKDEHVGHYIMANKEKLYMAPAIFGNILQESFLEGTSLSSNLEPEPIVAQEMLLKKSPNKSINCEVERKQSHDPASPNKVGQYGAGFATEDPIEARLMYNILNSYTIPNLAKPKKSELHESHINITSYDLKVGTQAYLDIPDLKIETDFVNADSFVLLLKNKEIKYINVGTDHGTFPSRNDYVYRVDKEKHQLYFIYPLEGLFGKTILKIGGKKIHMNNSKLSSKYINE